MLSDGRIILRALAKMSCLTCGSTFHASKTADEDIRNIYTDDYELAAASPKADAARARAYASWIRGCCTSPRAILEIGCGSGALLSELLRAWPDARACGVDPALPDSARSQGAIRLMRGFVEDVPVDQGPFDLILAVNVIEHTTDPTAFLRSLRERLAPKGKMIIICPDGHSPNVELLFFDHLYSLTRDGLRLAGGKAGLTTEGDFPAPSDIGDFQMMLFAASTDDREKPSAGTDPSRLRDERQSYLDRWSRLDQYLLDRSQSATDLLAFGAGQTAALLRTYAPQTWARVGTLVVDDPGDAWSLGPPVASYKDAIQNPGRPALVATTPHVQEAVARRLVRDDLHPITWNELIPR